jgi:hypothetical protein
VFAEGDSKLPRRGRRRADVFYKALGFAVWKLGIAYLRRRYARTAKIATALGVASLLAIAAYVATRSSE